MNLKQRIKNITHFSKEYAFNSFDHPNFVRHAYLAYAFVRSKELNKTENPATTKKPINVALFTNFVYLFKELEMEPSVNDLKHYSSFLKSIGYQVVGLDKDGNARWIYISGLMMQSSLSRLAALITSDRDISIYISNWKTINKLWKSNKYMHWQGIFSLLDSIEKKIDTVLVYSNVSFVNEIATFAFRIDQVDYIVQSNIVIPNSEVSLSIVDNQGQGIAQAYKERSAYDLLNKLKSSSLLEKINNLNSILKRRMGLERKDTLLTDDEIINVIIPKIDEYGYHVEFSFGNKKVLCEIIPKHIFHHSQGYVRYRSENNPSITMAFENALKLMIEKKLMWEIL